MTISVHCDCGKRFRAKDEHAGKKTNCPGCGRTLIIGAFTASAPSSGTPMAGPITDVPRHRRPLVGGGTKTAGEAVPMHNMNLAHDEHRASVPPQVFVRPQAEADKSPLDAEALETLRLTESYRRPTRHAAILFRIQFLFGVVLLALSVIVLLAVMVIPGSSGAQRAGAVMGSLLFVIVYGAVDVFLYYSYKATWDSQRWAPMVNLVLNTLATVFFVGSGLVGTMTPRGGAAALVGGFIAALGPGIIAFVCYRAWDAIPRFLRQPDWCRHTLLHCGL